MQTYITNFLLAIIAACLIFQVTQSFPKRPAIGNPTNINFPTDVRIVEVAHPLKVDVATVGGVSLDEVEGRVVLPVGIRNTVKVDISGVGGSLRHVTLNGDGLPVVILNK